MLQHERACEFYQLGCYNVFSHTHTHTHRPHVSYTWPCLLKVSESRGTHVVFKGWFRCFSTRAALVEIPEIFEADGRGRCMKFTELSVQTTKSNVFQSPGTWTLLKNGGRERRVKGRVDTSSQGATDQMNSGPVPDSNRGPGPTKWNAAIMNYTNHTCQHLDMYEITCCHVKEF